MKLTLEKNFDSITLGRERLIVVILIVCSLFYICICFGIYLSKITYGIADFFNKGNILKIVHFRKKFNFKNTIKFIFDYLVTSFIIWIFKIGQKVGLLKCAIWELIKGLYFFSLLVKERLIKGNLNWKELFCDFKKVLLLFQDLYYTFISFIQEVLFLSNLKRFFDSLGKIIFFFLTNSVLIAEFISFFYLLLLCFFGVLIGFLYGVYKKEDEIYLFVLLFLFRMMYEDELISDLDLIQPNKAKPFVLESVKPTNTFPVKRLSQEFSIDAQSKIPLPIFVDLLILPEFDFVWDESQKYKFELYKFFIYEKNKTLGIMLTNVLFFS